MLFHTPQFFLLLSVVLLLFYTLPKVCRTPLLVIASYWFYMSWNPKFIILLLSLTLIDYTAALWIDRANEPSTRKLALIVSLGANLGLLGFFKYYNFFASNIATLLGRPDHAFALSIILPLGISFHTFQSMSYVVDVYRRQQKPVRNILEYALFISFFPQLVAGPIVRAGEFFGDYWNWRKPTADEVSQGFLMIMLGLTKKIVLADRFAQLADIYFKAPATHPGMLTAWSGMISFGVQIYFDFSGYTDMAIGMAALLGFHFPENFRRPYLAPSITEFWRRWHISLSRWLRDYLYISLGGNRGGKWSTYRNLMLTMLLGGLWHGASWNFVIWGGYHGGLLAVERAAGVKPGLGNRWLYLPRAILTFGLAMIGWVFFRAQTFTDSRYVLSEAFGGDKGVWIIPRWENYLLLVVLALAFFEEHVEWFRKISVGRAWAYGVAVAIFLLTVELIGYTGAAMPFVYFQF